VILLGLALMIVGLLIRVAILWSLGLLVLLIGVVLFVLGAIGHAIGGRRHYF
jgi:hypothetical protein